MQADKGLAEKIPYQNIQKNFCRQEKIIVQFMRIVLRNKERAVLPMFVLIKILARLDKMFYFGTSSLCQTEYL